MSIIYIGSSSLQYLITKCKAAFASASHTHAADKTKLNGVATGANAYSHPTTTGNKHIPSGGASGQILRWSADGTAAWGADNNTTYSAATASANGLMSAADKSKLDGVATGANAYSHPTTTGNKHIPSGGASGQILRWSADGTTAWGTDNNTTYSAATSSANGLMSAADKAKLDGVATGANAYSHPTTSGNKHIPTGGTSGQILRWSADGTAAWGADNNTTYSAATSSANGLMSAADKAKLDGMPAGGVQGPAGQSAYQAAQAGGYTGTQAKFYSDLAAIEGLADLDETLAGI